MAEDPLSFFSHPHHRQDRWVIERALGRKRGGFFVDAGSGPDGIYNSNTYALESQLGWRGICIEAHPGRFRELAKNRSSILENVCLTDSPREVRFTLNHELPGTSAVLGELDDASREDDYDPSQRYEEIALPGVPLHEILRRHSAPRVIDYLSMDIEGSEWPALKDFPFGEYTFLTMTVERNSSHYLDLRRLLERNGYRVVENYCIDDFYVHESLGYQQGLATHAKTALRSALRAVYNREPLLSVRRAARGLRGLRRFAKR
jgi:FkbM family methyltransferase